MDGLFVPSSSLHRGGSSLVNSRQPSASRPNNGSSGGAHRAKHAGNEAWGSGLTSPRHRPPTTPAAMATAASKRVAAQPAPGFGFGSSSCATPAAGDSDKNGVYVAKDLWKAIRHNLDAEVSNNLAMRASHGRETAQLRQQLSAAAATARDFETQFRQAERTLSVGLHERTERAAALGDELVSKCREMEAMREEYQAQTDSLTDMLKNRDQAEVKADWLERSLDDTTFRLTLENHRHELSTGRVSALEKELAYFKERHSHDAARAAAAEARARDQSTAAADLKLQLAAVRQQVHEGESAAAGSEGGLERERLRGDNRRLVALLERTPEFRRLVQSTAELGGMTYVPLAEVLMDKEIVSERYLPEHDRAVTLGDSEALHWVPRQALDLTSTFLARLFPRLPVRPFTTLLLQLNGVWRAHEAACVKDLRRRHKVEMQRQRHREPYREVVMENRISHLRKQLESTRGDTQRLEQYRDASKLARSGHGGGGTGTGADNRALLEWGLATIENLSKQVAVALHANKILTQRLAAARRDKAVAGSDSRKEGGFGKVRFDDGRSFAGAEGGRGESVKDEEHFAQTGDSTDEEVANEGAGTCAPHQEAQRVGDLHDDGWIFEAHPGSFSMSPDAFSSAAAKPDGIVGDAGGSGSGHARGATNENILRTFVMM